MVDFDWARPKRCDRAAIEEPMTLPFMQEATDVALVGPNGVGKSKLARKFAHQALVHGHTLRVISAGQRLGDLAALDRDSGRSAGGCATTRRPTSCALTRSEPRPT